MAIYAIAYIILHLGILAVYAGFAGHEKLSEEESKVVSRAAFRRLWNLALILPVFGRVAGWW